MSQQRLDRKHDWITDLYHIRCSQYMDNRHIPYGATRPLLPYQCQTIRPLSVMHTETLPLSDCLHFGPDDGTLHQVVKPSTTLYFVGVFLARQPTLTERVHHSATKRGESITVIRRTKAKTDGQTTGVVFKAETTCTDRKCVQTVATVSAGAANNLAL